MDPLDEMEALVTDLRAKATEFPQSRKRDLALYEILAGGMKLVQILHRDDLLARAHEILPKGKFLKGNSDVYTLAAKLIFDDRYLVWRSSCCLRGLAMSQVRPSEVVAYLRDNGGMNSFSAERRKGLSTVTTRFIRLDKPITIERGGTVTLQLKHEKDTSFRVTN